MDIIDVMLAKALTGNGADSDGTAAAAAQQAIAAAQQAQAAVANVKTEEEIAAIADTEVKKVTLASFSENASPTYNFKRIDLNFPDGTKVSTRPVRLYHQTGDSIHDTMSQRGITEALATKADADTAATKTYVDEAIAEAISGNYNSAPILGVEINYETKTATRVYQAEDLNMGSDFDEYVMYGGRMRCNVADDGMINAFYGDANYRDDGSNGQVMVYQPKFYYKRIPPIMEPNTVGKIIRKDSILISATEQPGFKLHPLFKNTNNDEVDYVLLPAYNGAIVNDKLASIADQKPASNITLTAAEAAAQNRGSQWHITNMAAESANQMLEVVEFGSMNGQLALEDGIVTITTVANANCASQTGSTASLGNSTGAAESTTNITKGTTTVYSEVGKRAISYRGWENPWGNIWRMIGGTNIFGDGKSGGGIPYICTTYNYSTNTLTNDYESIGFCLPSTYGWISAMGYGNEDYDWVFMPAECLSASSVGPVGDNLWTNSNLNGMTLAIIGGSWGFGQSAGPFYYACDNPINDSAQYAYGASLMLIPNKGNIYTANITKWQNKMEG